MRLFLLLIGFFIFITPAKAEPVPGDSCASYPTGSVMRSGGPELGGKIYVMTCTGGIWTVGKINHVPQGCPNIGDICTGPYTGMIYAGEFNGNKLYAAADDAPTALVWGPNPSISGIGFCSSTEGGCKNGLENTQFLHAHALDFPAAEYCATLSAHGYDVGEWYLPSKDELGIVYQNLKQGKPENTLNFQNVFYWSSSEISDTSASNRYFGTGSLGSNYKSTTSRVRCVTR